MRRNKQILHERRLSVKQAAAHLERSISSIRRYMKVGVLTETGRRVKLESVLVGGMEYTSQEAIDRWIERCNEI